MTQLSFFVAGYPVTQAGMREVTIKNTNRRTLITTGGVGLKPWRKHVTQVAQLAATAVKWEKLTGPVSVTYRFLLPMAKSRPAMFHHAGIGYSFVMPDLDKLARAVGDSLTDAGVYKDDGQICEAHTSKYEVHDHALQGVEVVVAALYGTDAPTPAMQRLLERRTTAPRQR